MKTTSTLLLATILLVAGCRSGNGLADAYGNFESDEVTISSEASGTLVRFSADEGDQLQRGDLVAIVDTTQLALQRAQLRAQRSAIGARSPGIATQVDVVAEQRRIALHEKVRIENLVAERAATSKQLDDVNGQIAILDRQMTSIRSQHAPLLAELAVVDAQLALLDDQIRRSVVVNPLSGTVVVSYVEEHELTAPGRPLYKIAKLDTMLLRAYVSGAQLSEVRIGQQVVVAVDDGNGGTRDLSGVVSWIASEAEFTPKLIQTKDERVNLVYAFKVRVPNRDGVVKIGMPGEVWFDRESGTGT